jgi:hypothetical protein
MCTKPQHTRTYKRKSTRTQLQLLAVQLWHSGHGVLHLRWWPNTRPPIHTCTRTRSVPNTHTHGTEHEHGARLGCIVRSSLPCRAVPSMCDDDDHDERAWVEVPSKSKPGMHIDVPSARTVLYTNFSTTGQHNLNTDEAAD